MAQARTVRRSWLREWLRYLKGILTQVLGNPVIGRELRVRVRFGRSYLLQGAYLGFMIIATMLLYFSLDDVAGGASAFRIQQTLENFNMTLMTMLATLIVLIVPGLSASAITLERERRTLDLLLATPLTSRDLLTGKLVGSMAFVVLLLALTLPISAVSVVMGGMTIRELLTIYFLMAMSAMVLCSISLAISSFQTRSYPAIVWSYVAIGAFCLVVSLIASVQLAAYSGSVAVDQLLAVSAVLSPWFAPMIANTSLELFGWKVPVWLVSLGVCGLMTRLILTGSARRVGLYERDVVPSLRRQAVLIAGLAGFLTIYPIVPLAPMLGSTRGVVQGIAVLMEVSALLMAGVAIWLAPAHEGSASPPKLSWWFGVRRMFRADASGTLPFLILLWLAFLGAVAVAIQPMWGAFSADELALLRTYAFHATSLWFVMWALGRLVYALLPKPTTLNVRLVTLAILAALVFLPPIGALTTLRGEIELLFSIWILYPMLAVLISSIRPELVAETMTQAIRLAGVALVCALLGNLITSLRARSQSHR